MYILFQYNILIFNNNKSYYVPKKKFLCTISTIKNVNIIQIQQIIYKI